MSTVDYYLISLYDEDDNLIEGNLVTNEKGYYFNNLDNSKRYYYTVQSVIGMNKSAISTSSLVDLAALPIPIADGASEITETSFRVNWHMVSSFGDNESEGFVVEVYNENDVLIYQTTEYEYDTNFYISVENGLIYEGNVITIESGKEYSYKIKSTYKNENANIDSEYSNIIVLTTNPTYPKFVLFNDEDTLLYIDTQDFAINNKIINSVTTSYDGDNGASNKTYIESDNSSFVLNGVNTNIKTNNYNNVINDFSIRIAFRFDTGDLTAKTEHILFAKYDNTVSSPKGATLHLSYNSSTQKIMFFIMDHSAAPYNNRYKYYECPYELLENSDYLIQAAFMKEDTNNSNNNKAEICVNGIKQAISDAESTITNITQISNVNIPFTIGSIKNYSGTTSYGQFRLLRCAFDNTFRDEAFTLADFNRLKSSITNFPTNLNDSTSINYGLLIDLRNKLISDTSGNSNTVSLERRNSGDNYADWKFSFKDGWCLDFTDRQYSAIRVTDNNNFYLNDKCTIIALFKPTNLNTSKALLTKMSKVNGNLQEVELFINKNNYTGGDAYYNSKIWFGKYNTNTYTYQTMSENPIIGSNDLNQLVSFSTMIDFSTDQHYMMKNNSNISYTNEGGSITSLEQFGNSSLDLFIGGFVYDNIDWSFANAYGNAGIQILAVAIIKQNLTQTQVQEIINKINA